MAKKIPLKDAMSALDRGDKTFYNNLTDEQKKDFSPWLMMRYASSSVKHSEYYLCMINDLVNVNFSVFNKHEEFAWMVLSACGSGQVCFHPFIPPGKRSKSMSKIKQVIMEHNPTWKSDDADVFLKINSTGDLKEYLLQYGYTDKEIKETLK